MAAHKTNRREDKLAVSAALARWLGYPEQEALELLQQVGRAEAAPPLGTALRQAAGLSLEELRTQHRKVFGPRSGIDPYEAEQRDVQDFQKSQLMADVAGFYRAFGVEPRQERPDHLAAELEFLHLLLLKEKRAREAGEPEKAEICRDARESFLRDHLLLWAPEFAETAARRAEKAGAGFYGPVLLLLKEFVETEKEDMA